MRIGIIGGGESGVGAALLAIKIGDIPFVSDFNKLNPVYRQKLIENNVHFEEGGHTFDILVDSDIIVKSPGVKDDTPIILELRALGIPIISEIEYGYSKSDTTILAITGSNGKTTTSNLIFHILNEAGFDVTLGGNIGTSFCALLSEVQSRFFVLEVSSFQLDGIKTFKPHVAILLNITPDHLDRYGYDLDRYADSKISIAKNQDRQDVFIYTDDSDLINSRLDQVSAMKLPVHIDSLPSNDYDLSVPALHGTHNAINASAAILCAKHLGVDEKLIQDALSTFRNSKHRLEAIAQLNSILWINDSKATNIDAVKFALQAMDRPIIWIAGGIDKGNDYGQLFDSIENVKVLICLGVQNDKLKEAFQRFDFPIFEASSMDIAIEIANDHAEGGDCVLLSPACSSFDLFENYEDRGRQFEAGVWSLLRKRA